MTPSPCPLCSRGARGLYVLQGVREGVLDERKLDVVVLWTQTLLARDELHGWSGLRPYDCTLTGLLKKTSGQPKRMKDGPHHHLCTEDGQPQHFNVRSQTARDELNTLRKRRCRFETRRSQWLPIPEQIKKYKQSPVNMQTDRTGFFKTSNRAPVVRVCNQT